MKVNIYKVDTSDVIATIDIDEADGLQKANFAGMQLQGADFRNMNLYKANFTGANLVDARFGKSNCDKADFTHANLEKAFLSFGSYIGAKFRHTNLVHASIMQSDFTGANFTSANLDLANAYKSNFSVATLKDTTCYNVIFDAANFATAGLDRVNFTFANLRNVNFDNAMISDCKFDIANMNYARGNNSDIISMHLEKWDVVIHKDTEMMFIGCEGRTFDKWKGLSDTSINMMDCEALVWWRKHKEWIFNYLEILEQDNE